MMVINPNLIKEFCYVKQIDSLMLVFFLFSVCPMLGQTGKKKVVTENDYHLWGYLQPKQLSDDGQWTSFKMSYESRLDTLFIKHTTSYKTYSLPKGSNGEFNSNSNYFAYYLRDGSVNLLNLYSGQGLQFPKTKTYNWSKGGRYIAVYNDEDKILLIKDIVKDSQLEIHNVTEYAFNPKGNQLVYINSTNNINYIYQIHLETTHTVNLYSSKSNLIGLKWHQTKNSLVFLEEFNHKDFVEKSHIVHYYNGELRSFDHRTIKDFPKNIFISNTIIHNVSDLRISIDEERIFLPFQKWNRTSDTLQLKDHNDVEIWHYKDEEVFPRQHLFENKERGVKLGCWDLEKNIFFKVSNLDQELFILNENHTHALTYSNYDYLPLFKHQGAYSDYYLVDLENNTKTLFLEKMSLGVPILSSPSGRYFNYFKNNNWWIYDVLMQKHRLISKDINEIFFKRSSYSNKTFEPISFPVWSKDENVLFITGLNDVWEITLKDLKTTRLTDGYKSGLKYEIYKGSSQSLNSRLTGKNKVLSISNPKELILKLSHPKTKFTGFKLWKKNKPLSTIVYDDILADELFSSKNKEAIVFREQSYDNSPLLKVLKKGKTQTLFESNKHEKEYHWGSSKLIDYKNSVGDCLQGILYYPSNFNQDKKYPLVVIPYENQTQYYNQYFLPSVYNDGEMLTSVLNLKGYFVLLPDIKFELGNVGFSATDCIISATNKVKQLRYIDSKGIGIMGHSFGGFQTYFTITQTDLFSAAVAGSGYSDLISKSLSITSGFFNRPEMNYFEFGQPRMTKPFYEMQNEYIANSPIHQSHKVNTPLLSWFGKEDNRIKWDQGLYMYVALRRMNKENIFLVYPNEYHVLTKRKNKKDLTYRILDWFDYHLKHKSPKKWIIESAQY